ncbi:MAG: trypsin-like peptidase domain-containing protein [Planctomycetaceae bacterium]
MLAVLLVTLPAGRLFAQGDSAGEAWMGLQAGVVAAIERAEPSVVSVARVVNAPPFAGPAGRLDPQSPGRAIEPGFVPTDFGSGVVIAKNPAGSERFVLTAAHVVLGGRDVDGNDTAAEAAGTQIVVRLESRHVLLAEIVAADPRSDLAVLRLPLEAAGVPVDAAPPITIGNADDVRKGMFMVALGNPYAVARDGSSSASLGMVSNISRRPAPPGGQLLDTTESDVTIHHYGTLLHVDTRLDLGTSGGALVNLKGELVGMTIALAALEGYEKSVGYAIPIDTEARKIIDSLLNGFEVEYGFLGVHPSAADGDALRPYRRWTAQASAARIRRIAPGSPADRCGLEENDIVLAVNGAAVYDDIDLIREIGWLGPDVDATLTVLRPGERRVLTTQCRLGKWPVYDDSLLVTSADRHPSWRGLKIDYATARRRYLPTNVLEQFPQGVLVTGLEAESPAAKSGLVSGDLIVRADGVDVTTPREFRSVIDAAVGDVPLTLRDGRTVTIRTP